MLRIKITRWIACGLMCMACSVLGCGGQNPAEPEALTQQEVDVQVENICHYALSERDPPLSKVLGRFSADSGLGQVDEEIVLKKVVPPVDRAVRAFEELDAPQDEEPKLNKMVNAFRRGIAATEAAPVRLLEGLAFAEADDLSFKLGFPACAQI